MNCFRAVGSWARKCRCRMLAVCLCLLRKRRASSLARATRTRKIELSRLPSCVGQGLLKCDDIGERQSRHWCRGARVCPSRSVVIGARLLAAGRAKPETSKRDFVLFVVCCLLSCGGALLMACAPCSALCARLGAVCAARRCVRSALGAVFADPLCGLAPRCVSSSRLSQFVFASL